MSLEAYNNRKMLIGTLANKMREAVLAPQQNSDGTLIADGATASSNVLTALPNTIFDSCKDDAKGVMGVAAIAMRNYVLDSGKEPTEEMLASAYQSIENLLGNGGGIFDSLDTTDGIPHRNHLIAMVLPTMLSQITADDVTYVPAGFDKSEIFRVERVAGSTFGDLQKDEVIDDFFNGQYGTMDIIKTAGQTDGTTVVFNVDFGHALTKNRTMVYIDKELAISDLDRDGVNVAPVSGGTITLTPNYTTGAVEVKLSAGGILPAGLTIEVKADIAIENNESVIPLVNHRVTSYLVRPHESALSTSNTLIARLKLQRELSLDQDNMNLAAASNILAAEKDRRNIFMMKHFARHSYVFGMKPDASGSDSTVEHVRTLRPALAHISAEMVNRTKKTGVKTIYCSPQAGALLRHLPISEFSVAAGYREIPQPHVMGVLFGQYVVKCVPFWNDLELILVGKGTEHGDAGIVNGDAIPAMSIKHAKAFGRLRDENTMYELSLRDIHPYKGSEYLARLTLDLASTGLQQ